MDERQAKHANANHVCWAPRGKHIARQSTYLGLKLLSLQEFSLAASGVEHFRTFRLHASLVEEAREVRQPVESDVPAF